LGDVADITAIQEARVLQATSDELRKFAARYDVGSIVVAIAQAPQMAPEVTPADESQEAILAALVEDAAANTGPKAVVGPEEDAATARAIIQDVVASPMSVTLRHIGLGGEENMQVIIEPEPGEGLMAFLGRGVEASLLEVRERWKLTNLLDFDQKNVLIAKVPLDGRLASWLDVYEQLRRLPVIVGVELAELSKAAAMVRLTHLGDLEQLSFALDREALELVIDEAGWVVQHRGKKTPLNNTDNSQ
jgi:type II secretory pathway component PulM